MCLNFERWFKKISVSCIVQKQSVLALSFRETYKGWSTSKKLSEEANWDFIFTSRIMEKTEN